MPSKELESTHFLREREYQEFMALGAQKLDLTLIYNRHGSPTHAEQSVAHIEPNSYVFIEGFDFDGNREMDEPFTLLSELHLRHGINHEAYRELKQNLLNNIASEIYRPAEHSYDFAQHKLRELELLLKKDCLVHFADFRRPEHIDVPDNLIDFYDQFAVHANDILQPVIPSSIAKDAGIGKAIVNAEQIMRNAYSAHFQREYTAAFTVLQHGAIYAMTNSARRDVNLNEGGQVKAYMIYGTAHARSLTQQFIEAGMEPRVVIVNPLTEASYIERTPEEFLGNLSRKIGHTALSSLAHEYLGYEKGEAISDELYENLQFLNDDREEALKFIIRCLQVRKMLPIGSLILSCEIISPILRTTYLDEQS